MVRKYQKLPVVIEAILWEGDLEQLLKFCPSAHVAGSCVVISTLEGDMFAAYGDYLIKGLVGEFYPCKPDVFKLSYKEVSK